MKRDVISYKVLFIILIIAITLIKASSEESEFVPIKIYEFEFFGSYDGVSQMKLKHFALKYNFSEERGLLTFILDGGGKGSKIEEISIYVPILINGSILHTEILNCERNLCTKKSNMTLQTKIYNYTSTKQTEIRFYDSRNFKKDEKIKLLINFSSNMQPSGTFIFKTSEDDIESSSINFPGRAYILDLNFGKDYACSSDCFEELQGVKYYDIIDKHIFVEFTKNRFHIFKLHSLNTKKLFWKNLLSAAGVSLLVSVLVLALNPYRKSKE